QPSHSALLKDLSEKFDRFTTLLSKFDDRLASTQAQINNIDHCLCIIEEHLDVTTSTSDRHLYLQKEQIIDPSSHVPNPEHNWEISENDFERSLSASRACASRRG